MTGVELAERLKARPSGSGWVARCPAHADGSPSLSIRERDGKILLHCFAGCHVEDVCTAMGVRVRDLFSDGHASQPKPRQLREAERRICDLRGRLTQSERDRPVTVIYCNDENLEAGIARALALAVEGELCQLVLERANP
jgi:hypothetical protein